ETGLWKYVGAGGSVAPNSATRLRWLRCTAMILLGVTGGRWSASCAGTRRPSPATRSSPSRRTCTVDPSSTMRRYSGMGPPGRLGGGRTGPAAGRTVEPQVHLARADRVLVFAERPSRRRDLAAAERRDHHQVVREPGLWPDRQEFIHRVYHPGMVAR